MVDTTPNTHRTFMPDDDPMPELKKHLTAQQLYEIAQGMEFVKEQTGHGEVTIQFRNGFPRFISVTFGKELKP